MQRLAVILAIATVSLVLQSCESDLSRLEKMQGALNGSREYEATARRFVIRGRYGDLNGTFALLSGAAIKQLGGEESAKKLLQKDTIPALVQYPDIKPGGTSMAGSDEYGNPAWTFKETLVAANGRELKMEFTITREKTASAPDRGTLVVAYFGPWK